MSAWADDYDCADWGREEVRKARKEHTCDACERPIRPGEHYAIDVYGRGGYDPWIVQVKRCGVCERIYQHLSRRLEEAKRGAQSGTALYHLPDFIDPRLACGHEYSEVWGEEPPAELVALALGQDPQGES